MARTGQLAATVGDKGRVTLSEEVRKHLGVDEGDVVLIELTDAGTIEIVPAALIPRDQIWFAHADMQERMIEAHADIAAGRTTRISRRSELRSHLARLKPSKRQG
jgi:AbrB family looped-hinge helix DNA binding protein